MIRTTDDVAHDEQSSRLQAVLSVVSEGLIIRDREGLVVSCGDATPALLGLTPAELIGSTSPAGWKMIDSEGRSLKQEPMSGRETLRSGKAHPMLEVRVQLPDASQRWLEIRTGPIRRAGGELSGVVIALRDVTELQGLRDVARMNEARVDALLQDSDEGAFEMDLVSGSAARSLRVFQILGIQPAELSERADDWYRLIHPEDLPLVKDAWQEVLAGRKSSFDVEYRMRHADGRWIWVNARAHATRVNPRGIPLWMTGSITDVTRRREAEDALAKLRAELEHRAP